MGRDLRLILVVWLQANSQVGGYRLKKREATEMEGITRDRSQAISHTVPIAPKLLCLSHGP